MGLMQIIKKKKARERVEEVPIMIQSCIYSSCPFERVEEMILIKLRFSPLYM